MNICQIVLVREFLIFGSLVSPVDVFILRKLDNFSLGNLCKKYLQGYICRVRRDGSLSWNDCFALRVGVKSAITTFFFLHL